jgi:hypothetical protein
VGAGFQDADPVTAAYRAQSFGFTVPAVPIRFVRDASKLCGYDLIRDDTTDESPD